MRLVLLLGAMCAVLASMCFADIRINPQLEDMMEGTPEDFPRFYFSGHDDEARVMSRYLWYHFTNRAGNNKCLFNKEYLMVGDLWLGGAIEKSRNKPIQDVHREDILKMQVDEEGYVVTHQHASHSYDKGWPFPLWPQSVNHPDKANGNAVGWHFQNELSPYWFLHHFAKGWKKPEYFGESAADNWGLHNMKSNGFKDARWQLESTGDSPTITTPSGISFDSFQAPFLQIRWTRTGEPKSRPYVEWMREGDSEFSPDRRVYFDYKHAAAYVNEENDAKECFADGTRHSIITMYRHPMWQGQIKQVRISLAPGESDVEFAIDSFFTCYDTRHSINNPIFIFSNWRYFCWTGDTEFLKLSINRMRTALRYQMTEMGGLKYNHIRNEWPGHDGLPGYTTNPDGSKTVHGGHGIGNNYWDLIPFGWDDFYATAQYYASLLTMAEVEEAVLDNPGWNIARGASAFDPEYLREHAAKVKETANKKFWNPKTGRFYASIDKNGVARDYGFSFVNLEAIWYGIPTDEHAKSIMDWISGKRIVEGDTSTGEDIYRWQFGPRATTLRNVEWYGQGWHLPESIPWGGQIQDGGAVLGFAFYDLWARQQLLGADDAWKRLMGIVKWEEEVIKGGGYREYFKDGKTGTTLQGGGTAGGIGVDCEFFESSMLPAFILNGFMGVNPNAAELVVDPKLPDACPSVGVSNVLYHGVKLDIKAGPNYIKIDLRDKPVEPIKIAFKADYKLTGSAEKGRQFELAAPGVYEWKR